MSKEQAVGVHLRPWMLRELGVVMGLRRLSRAVMAVDPFFQMVLMAQGISEVAVGWLMMSPRGAAWTG